MGPDAPTDTLGVSRLDRAALWLIVGAAGVVAALWAVGVVLAAGTHLGDGPLTVDRMTIGNAETPAFVADLAAVTEARYESVGITVEGAPETARWLLWGAYVAAALPTIGIAVTLAWLCVRILRGRAFGRSLTAATVSAAILAILGGTASQILGASGRAAIVDFLGVDSTAGGDAGAGPAEGFAGFALSVDLGPVAIGVVLAVVAVAFQIGARMQQDTRGLV